MFEDFLLHDKLNHHHHPPPPLPPPTVTSLHPVFYFCSLEKHHGLRPLCCLCYAWNDRNGRLSVNWVTAPVSLGIKQAEALPLLLTLLAQAVMSKLTLKLQLRLLKLLPAELPDSLNMWIQITPSYWFMAVWHLPNDRDKHCMWLNWIIQIKHNQPQERVCTLW